MPGCTSDGGQTAIEGDGGVGWKSKGGNMQGIVENSGRRSDHRHTERETNWPPGTLQVNTATVNRTPIFGDCLEPRLPPSRRLT